jgi:hypothetical protein
VTRSALLAFIAATVIAASATGLASGAGASSGRGGATVFTGYGFDTCSAPSLAQLNAWLASPYRAIGIYVGGANRACPDGRLSSSWVAGAQAGGWNLLPLYVGLQAPCVGQNDLALIKAASAAAQGRAAADDAAERAASFGLAPGGPVYFDMEGYNTKNASCTKTVQNFLSAWAVELRAQGYVAGVYGSAASTIRDLVPLVSTSGSPDVVWIANWNNVEGVFGDPYVSDAYWSNHQRVHQYRGGHKEKYGGVTLNIDSNYVDGAVYGPGSTQPPPLPPPSQPNPPGSVSSSDGRASVTWPENAFDTPSDVALVPSTLAAEVQGFAAGTYVLQLQVSDSVNDVVVSSFRSPLVIHVAAPAEVLTVAYSPDETSWKPILRLGTAVVPASAKTYYDVEADGSIDVYTTVPGFFGLLKDVQAPEPATLSGRFVGRNLALGWRAARDNSGRVASYQITLGGEPLRTLSGSALKVSLHSFNARAKSWFRVVAVDAAGNRSGPSNPVVVAPTPKPRNLPRSIPRWAWKLYDWEQSGHPGKRPVTPRPLPAWYRAWAGWRLHPFRIVA